MCVICFKPQGVAIPEERVLKQMHDANSDGQGFMVAQGGRLLGAKFATFEELVEASKSIRPESPVVFHFRLATHGNKDMDGAHPFPFPLSKETAYAHQFEAPMAVMHNGIISGWGERAYTNGQWQSGCKWDFEKKEYVDEKTGLSPSAKKILSDTQDYLIWLSEDRDICNRLQHLDKAVLKMVAKWAGGKWALMRDSGKVRLLGSWEEVDGLWVSNTYWQWKYDNSVYFTGKHKERTAYIWKEKTTRSGGTVKQKEEMEFQEALLLAKEGLEVKYDVEWEKPIGKRRREKNRKKEPDTRVGESCREETGTIWSSKWGNESRYPSCLSTKEEQDKLAGETQRRDLEEERAKERMLLLGTGDEALYTGYFSG